MQKWAVFHLIFKHLLNTNFLCIFFMIFLVLLSMMRRQLLAKRKRRQMFPIDPIAMQKILQGHW